MMNGANNIEPLFNKLPNILRDFFFVFLDQFEHLFYLLISLKLVKRKKQKKKINYFSKY